MTVQGLHYIIFSFNIGHMGEIRGLTGFGDVFVRIDARLNDDSRQILSSELGVTRGILTKVRVWLELEEKTEFIQGCQSPLAALLYAENFDGFHHFGYVPGPKCT